MDDTFVCVISSGRGSSVTRMEGLLDGLNPVWIVPESQGAEYRYCGAEHLIEVPIAADEMPLPVQRNWALDCAALGGLWCVQFNDDLLTSKRFPTGLGLVTEQYGINFAEPISARQAITYVKEGMAEHGAAFGGIATTTNAYFYRGDEWATELFIMAHLMVFSPDATERFDTSMGVKEDYDMCLQHLANRGIALRANRVLGNFRHAEKSRGGCSPYRSLAYEQMMADHLIAKWGDNVVPNKRRPGEVLLKWKG